MSNSIRRWHFVNALIICIYICVCVCVCVCEWRCKLLNCVQLFVTPWIYSPWNSWDQNTGVGSRSILQGIVPTQGSNTGLLHCGQILYQLSHQGSPRILEWGAYLFSSRFSWPRNQTGVSCIAGGFFTHSTVSLGQAVLGPSKWSQYYCISHWRFSVMLLIPL